MPPHCDSMDGPVVEAARNALESNNVDLILPFAPSSAEAEIRRAFEQSVAVRGSGGEAWAVAERWFFETVVRLHLGGEGKPFNGLRPAGQHPPILRVAEEALRSEDAEPVAAALRQALDASLEQRFARVMRLKRHDPSDVPAARAYTTAMLDFIVWAHHALTSITAEAHGEAPAGPNAEGHVHLVH